MTDQEFATYRDGRYADAVRYYDKRARNNRVWYYVCSVYVLGVSGAIVPILTSGLLARWHAQAVAAILSPTVAVVAAISALFRFYEHWISYRATWDALQHEIHWRDAGVGPYYSARDRNSEFVERVEELISREGAEWLARQAARERADRGAGPIIA